MVSKSKPFTSRKAMIQYIRDWRGDHLGTIGRAMKAAARDVK
jgi:hypothetical protein